MKFSGLLLLACFAVSSLSGADFTWTGAHPGGGGGNSLSHNMNWAGGTAPASTNNAANLIFSGDQRLSPEINSAWVANSITFNNWASVFVVSGNIMTLHGNSIAHAISNNSVDHQTFNNGFILANAQSWQANTGNIQFNGTIELGAHALTFTGNQTSTVAGVISGTGSLVKSENGILQLNGANIFSGGTTVSAGTLRGSTTSLQGNIANNASLVFDQAAGGTFSGSISGTGTVTRSGSGVVTFSGANTASGDTIIHSGTLRVDGGNAIGNSSRVVLANTAGAIFDLFGTSETIGSLSGGGASGGNVTLGAGVLTVGADNTSTTYSGVISGTGQLVHNGSGMLTLAGTNAYSGGTTITAGTIQGTTTSIQGNITNNSSLIFNQTINGTFSGAVSGTGDLTRVGSGVLTLSGTNTYSGKTIIESGTLRISGGNAIPTTSRLVLANNANALFDLNDSNQTIGSLEGGGSSGGNITLGSGILSVGSDNTNSLYGGVISGTGQLNVVGSAQLTLTGNNTYSGGTTVSSGILEGTTSSLQGNITNNSELVFRQNNAGTYAGNISGSGDFFKRGSGNVTLTGTIDLSGAQGVVVERGILSLGANNVISPSTNLFIDDGASLQLGGYSVRVNELSFDNGILNFGVGGNNHFLFNEVGTYNGILTVQNWAEDMNGGIAFQSNAQNAGADFLNSIYFSGIGSGRLGDINQTIAGYSDTWNYIIANTDPFYVWGGGGNNNSWGTNGNWEGGVAPPSDPLTRVAFDGITRLTPSLNANITINTLRFNEGAGAFTLGASGNRELTLDGPVPSIIQMSNNNQVINFGVVLENTTIIDNISSGSLTLNGILSGPGGFTKLGENGLFLAGNNTFSGNAVVAEGELTIRHGNALGSTVGGVFLESGSFLNIENNISVGAQAIDVEGTLRNVSGDNTWGGSINGQGAIEVAGGTLTLSGTGSNTFSGNTFIGQGTLQLGKTGGAQAIGGDVIVGQGLGTSTLRLVGSNQIHDGSKVTLNASATPVFDLNGYDDRVYTVESSNNNASITLGSGTLTVAPGASSEFAGGISGAGNIVMAGSGTWILSGDSSYTGTTTVESGVLNLRHNNALGATAGGTTVAAGARLELQDNISIGAEALVLAGELRNVSGDNTFGGVISGSGDIQVQGGVLTLAGSGNNTFDGTTFISGGATLQLNKSDGATALGGVIIGSGAGTSTLRLLGSNQLANSTALQMASGGTPVFDLNNNNEQIGSIASANTSASVTLGTGTLTVGNGADTTFSGVISGSGGFTKTGSGNLTLTNQNTYTGATTVNQGTMTLGINNALSSSSNLTLSGGSTFNLNSAYSQAVNQFSFGEAMV